MSEATDTLVCSVCGTPATRIISGGAGLLFKGSGFYITDYGKDGKKDQQKPAAADSAPSEGKSGEGAKTPDKASDTKAAEAKPAASTGSGKSGSGPTE
jgi:predicted nucleic acid-binding Zn ribbon protein